MFFFIMFGKFTKSLVGIDFLEFFKYNYRSFLPSPIPLYVIFWLNCLGS